MAKKVNPKEVFRKSIMTTVLQALEDLGIETGDGEDYGFTSGTLVVKGKEYDMQLKPIVPKAKVSRYDLKE